MAQWPTAQGHQSRSPRARTSSASIVCACGWSCRLEIGGLIGADRVELDVPLFAGKVFVDALEFKRSADQPRWRGLPMPEGEAAIVPAAAHAKPVAAGVERD